MIQKMSKSLSLSTNFRTKLARIKTGSFLIETELENQFFYNLALFDLHAIFLLRFSKKIEYLCTV